MQQQAIIPVGGMRGLLPTLAKGGTNGSTFCLYLFSAVDKLCYQTCKLWSTFSELAYCQVH